MGGVATVPVLPGAAVNHKRSYASYRRLPRRGRYVFDLGCFDVEVKNGGLRQVFSKPPIRRTISPTGKQTFVFLTHTGGLIRQLLARARPVTP